MSFPLLKPWTTARRFLSLTSAALAVALVGCDDQMRDNDMNTGEPGVPGATSDPLYPDETGPVGDPTYAEPITPDTGFDAPLAPGAGLGDPAAPGSSLGDPGAPGGAMTGPETLPGTDPIVEPPDATLEPETTPEPETTEEPAEPTEEPGDNEDR